MFKGFFVEDGSFGLYNAFLFLLCLKYYRSKARFLFSAIFLLFIGISQSRAGAVTIIVVGVMYALYFFYKKKRYWALKLSVGVLMLAALRFGFYLFSAYTDSLFDYENLISLASKYPDNFWISCDRVPEFYILKEMIEHYPVLGIVMGNYQILPNSIEFLNGFPVTSL